MNAARNTTEGAPAGARGTAPTPADDYVQSAMLRTSVSLPRCYPDVCERREETWPLEGLR